MKYIVVMQGELETAVRIDLIQAINETVDGCEFILDGLANLRTSTPFARVMDFLNGPLFSIELIERHHAEFPDHGVDCSCMDKHIQRLRSMTRVGDPRLQRRIDHILRQASER